MEPSLEQVFDLAAGVSSTNYLDIDGHVAWYVRALD